MQNKSVLVIFLAVVLLFGVCSAQAEDYWMLNGQTNVYAGHDTNSSVIDVAGGGTLYTIIDSFEIGRWIKIAYSNQQTGVYTEGWISESLLETPSSLYSGTPNATEHQGDSRFANGNYQNTNQSMLGANSGMVLCESLSVRASADTLASIVTTIKYGEFFEILQDDGTWMRVRCTQGNKQYEGWLLSAYVLQNPTFLTTTAETPAYAFGSTTAKRVGLIGVGIQLPIIFEIEGFYMVSFRAASAFIQK